MSLVLAGCHVSTWAWGMLPDVRRLYVLWPIRHVMLVMYCNVGLFNKCRPGDYQGRVGMSTIG